MWLWPLSGGPEKRFETKKRRPLILEGAIMGNYKQQFVSRLFRSMFGCTFWSWANHGEQRQWNWLFLVAGRTKMFGKSKRYPVSLLNHPPDLRSWVGCFGSGSKKKIAVSLEGMDCSTEKKGNFMAFLSLGFIGISAWNNLMLWFCGLVKDIKFSSVVRCKSASSVTWLGETIAIGTSQSKMLGLGWFFFISESYVNSIICCSCISLRTNKNIL